MFKLELGFKVYNEVPDLPDKDICLILGACVDVTLVGKADPVLPSLGHLQTQCQRLVSNVFLLLSNTTTRDFVYYVSPTYFSAVY